MLHILDTLLHKFQLVYSSFYNVKSYTNLSLKMNEQKIAIQNFQTNSHPGCSQSALTILKIHKSSARALFLNNCTLPNFKCLMQCLQVLQHRIGLIQLLHRYLNFAGNSLWCLNFKMPYSSNLKKQEVYICHVWISLLTVYLLCAWELWQNNALSLQFWCLSNALTLPLCAHDASKS